MPNFLEAVLAHLVDREQAPADRFQVVARGLVQVQSDLRAGLPLLSVALCERGGRGIVAGLPLEGFVGNTFQQLLASGNSYNGVAALYMVVEKPQRLPWAVGFQPQATLHSSTAWGFLSTP